MQNFTLNANYFQEPRETLFDKNRYDKLDFMYTDLKKRYSQLEEVAKTFVKINDSYKIKLIELTDRLTSIEQKYKLNVEHLEKLIDEYRTENNFIKCSKAFVVGGKGILENGISKLEPIFHFNTMLTKIVLNNSITSVENSSFRNCLSLRTIKFNNIISKIGDHCFENCVKLKTIIIPNSVTSIGQSAFKKCFDLRFIKLSNNISDLKPNTFYECSSMNYIYIPSAVSKIGSSCFENCFKLRSMIIPHGVTLIPERCFRRCKNLHTISSKNIVNISIESFAKCCSLTNIRLDIKFIGERAFYKCSELVQLNIENCVKINNQAFSSCSKLSSIVKNNNCMIDGDNVFDNCYNLVTTFK